MLGSGAREVISEAVAFERALTAAGGSLSQGPCSGGMPGKAQGPAGVPLGLEPGKEGQGVSPASPQVLGTVVRIQCEGA